MHLSRLHINNENYNVNLAVALLLLNLADQKHDALENGVASFLALFSH